VVGFSARNLISVQSRTAAARRDVLVVIILVAAVFLLLWNGGTVLQIATEGRSASFGTSMKVAATAIILNVALILFGWRRYVDLQHEAELRAAGERRAALLASTDPLTGLANRKGFADELHRLIGAAAASRGQVAILSVQMQRFKSVNDRHGYDVGDALLRRIAAALSAEVPPGALVARLSGDEFAIALGCSDESADAVEQRGEALLRIFGRSYDIEGTLAHVGAFVGIAVHPALQIARPADRSAAPTSRWNARAADGRRNPSGSMPAWSRR
jgi:diguanylate cyclase (GGDEF)-like protein